jgi:hypothetical protein
MQARIALLLVALVVAGCGAAGTEPSAAGDATAAAEGPVATPGAVASETPEPPGAGPSPSAAAPAATAEAPFDTVDAVGGGQIDGAELAGRDLALWFWAPW